MWDIEVGIAGYRFTHQVSDQRRRIRSSSSGTFTRWRAALSQTFVSDGVRAPGRRLLATMRIGRSTAVADALATDDNGKVALTALVTPHV
jgi:hypothetical protein